MSQEIDNNDEKTMIKNFLITVALEFGIVPEEMDTDDLDVSQDDIDEYSPEYNRAAAKLLEEKFDEFFYSLEPYPYDFNEDRTSPNGFVFKKESESPRYDGEYMFNVYSLEGPGFEKSYIQFMGQYSSWGSDEWQEPSLVKPVVVEKIEWVGI